MNNRHSPKKKKKQIIAESYLHLVPGETIATPRERGYCECPCPEDCVLHGDCILCTAYHARKKKLPRCERGELLIS